MDEQTQGIEGGVLPLQRPDHIQWCREQVDMLNEGGVWGVPRSGLVFVKTGDNSIALIAREPEGRGELRAWQDADYRSIRDHMKAAGIEVSDRTASTIVERVGGEPCDCLNCRMERGDA